MMLSRAIAAKARGVSALPPEATITWPSPHFAINTAWLELSLTALGLLAWMRTLLLLGELATAEPKKLRYRLLHAAARITRGGRRLQLRISATWPRRNELTSAFARLTALPRPAA
ncbi:hypothetical protein J2Z30_003319 [Streptomyces iranensis]|uniref:Transposase DDE domain-containing protein n=1 Tax=Streptomyces iranensis TaxID=576784 RepID=A0ABS4MRG6_9ACTN|nr:hypothetical protein [Streptomyces iranensis]